MATQYATRSDLNQLGVTPAAFQDVSDAAVDAALLAASEEADQYLRARYALPLSAWGSDLKRITCKIAVYTLMAVRGYNPNAGADTYIRLGYEDAIRTLEGVARQAVHLNVTPSFTAGSIQQIPQVRSNNPRGW